MYLKMTVLCSTCDLHWFPVNCRARFDAVATTPTGAGVVTVNGGLWTGRPVSGGLGGTVNGGVKGTGRAVNSTAGSRIPRPARGTLIVTMTATVPDTACYAADMWIPSAIALHRHFLDAVGVQSCVLPSLNIALVCRRILHVGHIHHAGHAGHAHHVGYVHHAHHVGHVCHAGPEYHVHHVGRVHRDRRRGMDICRGRRAPATRGLWRPQNQHRCLLSPVGRRNGPPWTKQLPGGAATATPQ